MYLKPNPRRTCRCVACHNIIDPESSDFGYETMCLVTGKHGSWLQPEYTGTTITVYTPFCSNCEHENDQLSNKGCVIGIVLAILAVILHTSGTGAALAGLLVLGAIVVLYLINASKTTHTDAYIIGSMEGVGFNVGMTYDSDPRPRKNFDRQSYINLLAKLCVKYDYVLMDGGRELMSVEILRDKHFLDAGVAASIINRDDNTESDGGGWYYKNLHATDMASDIHLDIPVNLNEKLRIEIEEHDGGD